MQKHVSRGGADRRDGQAVAELGPALRAIASGQATSRTALGTALGLSRATIAQRLERLFALDLVREGATGVSHGGRPARTLHLNPDFGVALTAEIGETRVRVAVSDLTPSVLAEHIEPMDVARDPARVLGWILDQCDRLLVRLNPTPRRVVGLGLNVSAPVDYAAGQIVGPSVMTGWDGFDIPAWISRHRAFPVFVDNDVNLLTLAESRAKAGRHERNLFFIKVGNGIGSGIVSDGRLYRGAQGVAGDIGHMRVGGSDEPLCRCGKLGCVEARAAGWALVRDLRARGHAVQNARDVVALVNANVPDAIQLVRDAGRVLGDAAAFAVSILNPGAIVLGGTLAAAGQHLLSGVIERVHQQCLPLATSTLRIAIARNRAQGGTLGAARLVIEGMLAPDRVATLLLAEGPLPGISPPTPSAPSFATQRACVAPERNPLSST